MRPNICNAAVLVIKPRANRLGLTAKGISKPWADPWKKPKIPTHTIVILTGNFLPIATAKPKIITDIIIPGSKENRPQYKD